MDAPYAGEDADRLRELHHAVTALTSATDATDVYLTTVETAESVLGFERCRVFLGTDDGFEVVAPSHEPTPEESPADRASETLLARTLREREAVLISERDGNDRPASVITVPIGESAVLYASSTTPGSYGRTELELAELLAFHATAALEQIHARAVVSEQKEKIRQLHAVTMELESCESRSELFELMREASREILGLDWCTFYAMEDGEFVVAMRSERSPVAIGEQPFEGNSKTREVFETGESAVYEDVQALGEGEPTTDRIRAALQVPVGNLGVFNAASERPGAFDESDLELVELLSISVAGAHERIEARERLRTKKHALEKQNERLDQFISIVSHDLRNPLNVAQLQADLARQTGDDEWFEKLETAHRRMENMIDELLIISRAEQTAEDTRHVSLATQPKAAWETVETDRATLVVDVDPTVEVEANAELLQHVFENLFRNAVEHNDTPITVEVGLLDDESAGFYVEDDGRGIPEDDRERVFEHGYTTENEGTGFGLSIVREFVEVHGWRVGVGDADAGGARFEIRLDGSDSASGSLTRR